jgi:hypothetical protein
MFSSQVRTQAVHKISLILRIQTVIPSRTLMRKHNNNLKGLLIFDSIHNDLIEVAASHEFRKKCVLLQQTHVTLKRDSRK